MSDGARLGLALTHQHTGPTRCGLGVLGKLRRIYGRAYVALHRLQDLDIHGRPYLASV